jgi:hypothetical protein
MILQELAFCARLYQYESEVLAGIYFGMKLVEGSPRVLDVHPVS